MTGSEVVVSTAAAVRRTRSGRRARPGPAPGLVFVVATLLTGAVLFARSSYLFTTHIAEAGDQALNSALADKAAHFHLLIGNYSRVGFHHPGPAFLYLLAAGEALFYDVLSVVPSPFNAQLLGVYVADAIMIGLIVRIVYRITASVAAAAVSLGVIVLYCGTQPMLAVMWFPFLYVTPFGLLVASATAVAAGYTSELWVFVLAGCLLIHGHVSFIMFVGVTAIAVAAGWSMTHRGSAREELAAHRSVLVVVAVIIAVFALPMLIETIGHWPDPWRQYWDYATGTDVPKHDHPLSRSWHYLTYYWAKHLGWEIAAILGTVAGLAMTLTERGPERRRFFTAFYGVAALETVLTLGYIARGVDELTEVNRYTCFFYFTVPMLIVAMAAAQLATRAQERDPRAGVALLGAGAVMFGAGAAGPRLASTYRGDPALPRMVPAMQDAAPRAGRPVELSSPGYLWPQEAGIMIAADRADLPMCIKDPSVSTYFTSDALCHGAGGRFTVAVIDAFDWNGKGRVLWRHGGYVVLAGDDAAFLIAQ